MTGMLARGLGLWANILAKVHCCFGAAEQLREGSDTESLPIAMPPRLSRLGAIATAIFSAVAMPPRLSRLGAIATARPKLLRVSCSLRTCLNRNIRSMPTIPTGNERNQVPSLGYLGIKQKKLEAELIRLSCDFVFVRCVSNSQIHFTPPFFGGRDASGRSDSLATLSLPSLLWIAT